MPLFEVQPFDREFYEERLKSFLPSKLIDIHTHVWLDRFKAKVRVDPLRAVTWPERVAVDNSLSDLTETYRLLFPDKRVLPLIFGLSTSFADDLNGGNEYIRQCTERYQVPSLIFADPRWTESEFEKRVSSGQFLGAKVYLTLSDPRLREEDIQIYDFLPHHQLRVLDEYGWIVMLHIPRKARLRDPLNLTQVVEIERRYPNVKVIIAHVGRAYCPEDVGNAFEVLAETNRMLFDISANTCCEAFEQLIAAVGPQRILFGSDLPILRMRARRICEGGTYVNLVPMGMYGVVSGDPHMREVGMRDAEHLTFLLYEEIDAFRRAALKAALGKKEIEDIFHGNAVRVLCEAGMPVSYLTAAEYPA
jgi:predicted TIM-barrel fold metal-dependent hydrolase